MTDSESPGELGDTHLLINEAARLAGVGRSAITHHLSKGHFQRALAWVTPDHCSDVQRSAYYVAIQYDAALHNYIKHGGIQGQHNDKKSKARQLAKQMSLRKVSGKTGVPLHTLKYWARMDIIQTQDIDASRKSLRRGYQRRRKKRAYHRQCKAIKLKEAGASVGDIAQELGVSKSTVYQYLRQKYDPVK